jgi:hypothetical protein
MRRIVRASSLAAFVIITAMVPLTLAGTASAYAPSSTTSTTIATSDTISVTIPVGQAETYTFTGFQPNETNITVTINGTLYTHLTADGTGTIVVTVASSGGPHLSINGGTLFGVSYGVSTVVIHGATRTQTILVNIPSPASNSGLAYTGAEISAMVGGAVILVAAGTLLILSTRRRSTRINRR